MHALCHKADTGAAIAGIRHLFLIAFSYLTSGGQ